jgi:hypothetical protein
VRECTIGLNTLDDKGLGMNGASLTKSNPAIGSLNFWISQLGEIKVLIISPKDSMLERYMFIFSSTDSRKKIWSSNKFSLGAIWIPDFFRNMTNCSDSPNGSEGSWLSTASETASSVFLL